MQTRSNAEAAEYAQRFEDVLAQLMRKLFPWQRRWLKDRSKFKVALKARQLGYTTVTTLDAAVEAAVHPGQQIYLVSTTVDNASKLLRQLLAMWLPSLQLCGHPGLAIAKQSETVVELANGSRIHAISNEPDRMRGNVGVYYFDEMAFWEARKLQLIMDAVQPTVENPLNPTARFVALSTPWFADGLYHDICKKPIYDFFSRHEIDIYRAVREGLKFDLERTRGRMTAERWHREYCCGFIAGGQTYFSREGLLLLHDELVVKPDQVEIYLGVDLAKISDFTAIVVLARGPWGLRVLHTYQLRSMDYGAQARVIEALAKQWGARAVAVDITKHASFVDQAPPGLKKIAIGKDFTWAWKAEWVPKLKQAAEEGAIHFDFDAASLWDAQVGMWTKTTSRILLDDMARVIQGQTPSGKVRFDVPRSKIGGVEADGHGDSFSALLLAYWLASGDDVEWGGELVRPVIASLDDELPFELGGLTEAWQGEW